RWLLAAGALVLTLRVPVPVGGDSVMLLAPLYAVIALGVLVLLSGELRALRVPGAPTHVGPRGAATRLVDVGAASLPAIGTLSILWSIDVLGSAEQLAFFYVPFLLLFALVRTWVRDASDLRPAAVLLVGVAAIAATAGIVQWLTLDVWWNPKVIGSNRFRGDFRTNSLFWDPNIYGRALVVASLAVLAQLLAVGTRGRSQLAPAVAVLALFGVALWHTYSQSSWFALAAALAVLGLLTLPRSVRRWSAMALIVVLAAGVPFARHALSGADAAGRGSVARLGLELAQERPVQGWGIGTFAEAATEQARANGDAHPPLVASHATPVTVLAELGILGALAYLVLLGGAALAAVARWQRPATGRPVAPVIWATAAIVAVTAHSLLYAGFFEDASLWAALAVLASLPRPTGHDTERSVGTRA
ncbi:MAG: O-antigen polymerase, partial [Thermoleophilia bacterium]|nr:O-antigen polymerase [Thermoleophilia bacterium]